MKKAEAISILATSVRPREAKDRARYDEAVKMAIEALKSSETPKSSERTAESAQNTSSCARENDVIFQQAAIDALRNTKFRNDLFLDIGYKNAINIIESLPSVQPERKRGEWINEGRIIRCNKCKIGYAVVKGMKSAITYNFCPSCGAYMGKGEPNANN